MSRSDRRSKLGVCRGYCHADMRSKVNARGYCRSCQASMNRMLSKAQRAPEARS